MGSGKSTYLMLILAHLSKAVVTIVLPNIKLAQDIRNAILASKQAMKVTRGY